MYIYTYIYLLFLRETFLFLHTFNVCNSSPAPKEKAWGTSWLLDVPPEGDFSSDHRQSMITGLGLDWLPGAPEGQWASKEELKVPGGPQVVLGAVPSLPGEPLLSTASLPPGRGEDEVSEHL